MKKVLFLICSAAVLSCGSDNEKQTEIKNIETTSTHVNSTNEHTKLNLSILLDLSDRIDPNKYKNETMPYYKRDIGYITSISNVFNDIVRSKKSRLIDDKIEVFFEPAPNNSEINKLSSELKYHFNRNNASKDYLNTAKQDYSTKPELIYDLAIKDNNYVGSDIWRFFKNKVVDFCIENDKRNILVILTDGYIYHKNSKFKDGNKVSYFTPQTIRANDLTNSNWEKKMNNEEHAIIPLDIDLSNLEILVLGINASESNLYDEDVIKKYWTDWFNAMGVKKFYIKNAELPSNMDRVIKKFILE